MSLRPRTAPELVDAAVSLARASYGWLITIGAFAYLPVAIVRVIGLRPSEDTTPQAVDLFLTVYDMVWISLGWAAMMVLLGQRYLGASADLASAIRAVHRDAWRITVLSVSTAFVTLVGLVLFILPGLYFMVRFFAIPQTLLFERNTMRDAFIRSLWLSRHDQKRLAVTALITLGANLATLWGLGAAIRPMLPAQWHADLIAGAVQLFIQPFFAAVWLLFYFDVRMRVEGLDVTRALDAHGRTSDRESRLG
ncbi:MAG TPA: hypothetical protein VK922_10215 [Gemmatimonadaceae bacterium]|nr:hypothetical protein [Gemmatimonadaceae bacterium]